ncbi:hypothetical protein A3K55_00690 [Candidatus Shapirobacteria bacterium RBG_13_44_7]|uniref:Uncharacterized protein n=1 Tax=Candidatus Shapirobacteria bacterium RBG_13_44_7 TaxID=1802149 RepID=A0A1F7SES4_9BACT|nr:MAG: hypothetical protein A3K55_00690 [Candidatus Shapirobacteria bacterium RBG_13_44_7]
MEIPNLTTTPSSSLKRFTLNPVILIIVGLALFFGFWFSRFFPSSRQASTSPSSTGVVSADTIKEKANLKVGQVYGNANGSFKDTATGVIEKGGLNGEGTHILKRSGGVDQQAALTSSILDLDLFVDRKVEVKGETNASNKTGWLLDVGSVKILE